MAENSKIEWTDHTFNPWIGCTKVSDGCKHCYAETLMDKRYGRVKWGPQGTRVRTSAANWKKPLKWNREQWLECEDCHWRGTVNEAMMTPRFACPVCEGEAHPTRARVFCASLADVFEDRPEVAPWREELFGLIGNTPNLDWLLLTKRPENVNDMFFDMVAPVRLGWEDFPNIWIGTSVENQEQANRRIPHLLQIPAAVKFLSMEPLLGSVDISIYMATGWTEPPYDDIVNWVIVGGESGHHARAMHPDWARSIRDQCVAAGVPFLFKQWGEFIMRETTMASGLIVDKSRHEKFVRIGKRDAGRLLDGRTWDQFPEVAQ